MKKRNILPTKIFKLYQLRSGLLDPLYTASCYFFSPNKTLDHLLSLALTQREKSLCLEWIISYVPCRNFIVGGKSAHPRAKLACEASQPRLETGWLQAIKKQRDTHTHSVLCSCFIGSIIFLATLKTFSQKSHFLYRQKMQVWLH